MAKIIKNNRIVGLYPTKIMTDVIDWEIYRTIPNAKWFIRNEPEREIEIMTTITAKKYECEKCGMTEIPSGTVLVKQGKYWHLIKSSISGGGSRYCGPVKEESKPKNV